jgi:hypothetical protein
VSLPGVFPLIIYLFNNLIIYSGAFMNDAICMVIRLVTKETNYHERICHKYQGHLPDDIKLAI